MADINQSLNEGVCIDEEVFFGPVTDKERRIREHFENAFKSENKITGELPKIDENDISKNDSLYMSFSVDSKYDSFDDSLNEDHDKKPQGTKHAPLKKSLDKLKPRKHSFYDSLEDVCSLASNIEKCSISCEVENEKQHVIDDSLRNPPAAANKKCYVNEQIHFDDDSLAIVEIENTFDDSLEEFNVLSSIEIEEINDIEIVACENQNASCKVEQTSLCASRNLFETSVQVIYENKREADMADQEASSDDKNMLYDSLSNSDLKDILKDSIEESEKCFDNLLKHVSDVSVLNAQKSEEFTVFRNIEIDKIEDAKSVNPGLKINENVNCASRNLFDTSVQVIYESKREADREASSDKNMLYDSSSNSDLKDSLEEPEKCFDNLLKRVSNTSVISMQNSEEFTNFTSIEIDKINDAKSINPGLKMNENVDCTSRNHFDTSVQIIWEKGQETVIGDQEETSEDKNVLYDSLSNSDFKDIIKDCLEESEKHNISLKHASNAADTVKLEQISLKPDILDDSVQIVYENLQNFHSEGSISNNVTDSELNILKHSLEKFKNDNKVLNDQRTGFQNTSPLSCADVPKTVTVDNHNAIYLDSNANQNCKESVDKFNRVLSKQDFPVSTVENQNVCTDTFTVDSCHLKLLNDNINVNKDLKFELHIEVTVGDKKCKIAAEDIKLLPVTNLNSKINETSSLTLVPAESESSMKKEERIEALDSFSYDTDYKKKEHNINDENILYTDSNENMCQKLTTINEDNVTRRAKAVSQHASNSDLKFNLHEYVYDDNLLRALDLHNISSSFLNESIIQSNDSVIPLNLCSREQDIKNIQMSLFGNESKENLPDSVDCCKEKVICSPSKKQSKLNCRKTPKSAQKSPRFKETKRTPGTKIPVRKVENFFVPTFASSKLTKQVTGTQSAEKGKKHPYSQTPHSTEKKTPMSTPNKTPHFCKVRNTIFSKVPQIVPSKKYINIQSPVAQYIRNTPGSAKTPTFDPVLRDCMNRMHQQLESPSHLYQTTKSGSAKSTKRKV